MARNFAAGFAPCIQGRVKDSKEYVKGDDLLRDRGELSRGLRPIPPPCLGGGSETSWTLVGISWLASRGPLGGSLGASWGPFWGLLGPLLGLLGASWGVLGGS